MWWIDSVVADRVNSHEAKAHLSRLLAELKPGSLFQTCRRNAPAELGLLPQRGSRPRPIGSFKGRFELTDELVEPLPDEVLSAFEALEQRGCYST